MLTDVAQLILKEFLITLWDYGQIWLNLEKEGHTAKELKQLQKTVFATIYFSIKEHLHENNIFAFQMLTFPSIHI